jgi:hypothetical protein
MTPEIHAQVLGASKLVLLEHIDQMARSDPKGSVNYARNLACQLLRAAGVDVVDSCSVHEHSVSILITDSQTYGGDDE